MAPQRSNVFQFSLFLEREDGRAMGADEPEALLDFIIEWAEQNGYQIGGGYRVPRGGQNDHQDP